MRNFIIVTFFEQLKRNKDLYFFKRPILIMFTKSVLYMGIYLHFKHNICYINEKHFLFQIQFCYFELNSVV